MADSAVQPLLRTLPGRAIVVGIAVKLLVFAARLGGLSVPAFVALVDTLAGVAIAAGAAYVLVQLFLLAKRRLLWRVRRKLILSYIFIGFVPAILIVVFFLLGALLMFFNFSSYLVQAEVRSLDERVRFAAAGAALEFQRDGGRDGSGTLNRLLSRLQPEFPGASAAIVPADRTCTPPPALNSQLPANTSDLRVGSSMLVAGPWAHVSAPRSVPRWIGCDGFSGLLASSRHGPSGDVTEMFARGVAFSGAEHPGYAVVVDLPDATDRVRRNAGVGLRSVSAVDIADGKAAPLEGRGDVTRAGSEAAASAGNASSGALNWVTFLNYRDWNTGESGTLLVSTQVNLQDIYRRISAAQGVVGDRPFGQAVLLVLLVVVGGLFFVIEVVALIAGSALARSITGSVHELFAGTERVRQGDFSHKIAITANDQLGELAGSFNDMTASIEDLLRQKEEKKRLEEELRIAHEIQMSLLPQGPLAMPGLSATAVCIPAREVGGDYYDFLPLDDRRVGILIADVSGKGTSAALYMAQLKGLVLSLSRIHASPRALLVAANRLIAQHLDARSFITVTYAVIDLRERTMTYARAGHTPLIHVPGDRSSSRSARILAPNGMVVGLKLDDGEMFEQLLEEEAIPLQPGDLYVFFTDGISEAMNAADDCFGEVRLGQLVEDHADLPSEELRERVLREIGAFVDGAPQHDDMTMVLLRIGELPQAKPSTTEDAEDTEPKTGSILLSSVSSVVESESS
jgi:phosphoserine phosphatase RsbU/P